MKNKTIVMSSNKHLQPSTGGRMHLDMEKFKRLQEENKAKYIDPYLDSNRKPQGLVPGVLPVKRSATPERSNGQTEKQEPARTGYYLGGPLDLRAF